MILTAALACPAFSAGDGHFSDVGDDDWFSPFVRFVYEKRVMDGVSASEFDPGGAASRAMTVTVLRRIAGEPSPKGDAPFRDVREDWYRDAVAWAAERGLTRGTGPDTFGPDDPVTREQFATFMMRFSELRGGDVTALADLSSFPDADEIDVYAVEAVSHAVATGLIKGSAEGGSLLIRPHGELTRAELATILARYIEAEEETVEDDSVTTCLSAGIRPRPVDGTADKVAGSAALTDFALRLLRGARDEGDDNLVSPLSVAFALAMTEKGAKGETKEQMEKAFGLSEDETDLFLHELGESIEAEEDARLSVANSVWFTSSGRFMANEDFLRFNADYFGADIFKTPFDATTLRDINGWVNEKTHGMIPEILDRIPYNAVMYLINALAFEADWARKYAATDLTDGTFTREDGEEVGVDFMRSEEHAFIEDGGAVGFIKNYEGGKYAFAAILPEEGATVSDYLASLDGERLSAILGGARRAKVNAYLPKFETEFNRELSAVLKAMGMTLPFDEDRADLSGLGVSLVGNLYISRVIHKTFISVTESGTRAGAATVVEIVEKNAAPDPDVKTVRLDRPFLYMIIDTETNVPIFIGTQEAMG